MAATAGRAAGTDIRELLAVRPKLHSAVLTSQQKGSCYVRFRARPGKLALLALALSVSFSGSDAWAASSSRTTAELTFSTLGVSATFFEATDFKRVTLCSGVLVGRAWVLTARHCVLPTAAGGAVGILNAAARDAEYVDAVEVFPHPSLDVALVRLGSYPKDAPTVFATVVSPEPCCALDQYVAVGFGHFGKPPQARRRVWMGQVEDATADTVTVWSENGGCLGDSGAALFAASSVNTMELLGVLSRGSASCRGSDSYIRASGLRTWLQDTINRPFSAEAGLRICVPFAIPVESG
jgi:Trypsin